MKIAVLMGGNSSEHDISLTTGEAVTRTLLKMGHEAIACPYEKNISEVSPLLQEAELVFNALHGGEGEDGTIQQFLEGNNICYTGSGPEASVLAMDKHQTKALLKKNHILTPSWLHLKLNENDNVDYSDEKFTFPVVVKPNGEGSTLGFSLVEKTFDLDEAITFATQFDSRILVEEYIPGREITVAILHDEALPIVEIKPSHNFYDYTCKYTPGMSQYICPADLNTNLTEEIQKVSLQIFQLLGCRHYARVDFRLNPENKFYCLEVNTLPGMTGTSLVPKAAEAAGLTFSKLISEIINMAIND
ncbi:MAG: D-alanine--D-alanine ligase [Fidelibacterota bacterium]